MTITKNQAITASAIVFVLVILFGIRFFSPEDEWICENGKWVAHGKPESQMPIVDCKSSIGEKVFLENDYCQKDSDCACGANKSSGACFVGNKNFIDKTKQCPGFCSDSNNDSSIKCVKNKCVKVG